MAANLRFKIARMAAGLTQKRLAELCGTTESAVTKLETGRVVAPPPEQRQRIAEVLGVQPFEVFDR